MGSAQLNPPNGVHIMEHATGYADSTNGCAGRPPPKGGPCQRRLIVLEGEVGAGKSTLGTLLTESLRQRGFNVRLILEPVDRWRNILPLFYADPAGFAFTFQTLVNLTLMKKISAVWDSDPHADVYILERSPASGAIFLELQRGVVDPAVMQLYADEWHDAWRTLLPINLADAQVLYLRPSIEVCMARIESRMRPGEGGVKLAYLVALRRAHEAFLLGRHRDEYPLMLPCPYKSVTVLGPDYADMDFRVVRGEPPIITAILRQIFDIA